jgi:hypothetical protein
MKRSRVVNARLKPFLNVSNTLFTLGSNKIATVLTVEDMFSKQT